MKITKSQLRRIIREALSTEVPDIRPHRKSSFQVRKEKELAAKRKSGGSKGWFLLGLDGTLAKSQKTRTPIWWSDKAGAQRAHDNGYGGEGAVPVEILLVPDMYAYNGSNADPADLESVRQHLGENL